MGGRELAGWTTTRVVALPKHDHAGRFIAVSMCQMRERADVSVNTAPRMREDAVTWTGFDSVWLVREWHSRFVC
jgi:hypothetical protein